MQEYRDKERERLRDAKRGEEGGTKRGEKGETEKETVRGEERGTVRGEWARDGESETQRRIEKISEITHLYNVFLIISSSVMLYQSNKILFFKQELK